MIFKQADQVTGRKQPPKSQTRRPVKEGERWDGEPFNWVMKTFPGIRSIGQQTRRIKWSVGETYAVQPGRSKKAVGRILITKIRRERLGDIGLNDCLAEGIEDIHGHADGQYYVYYICPVCQLSYQEHRDAYACLWDHCYGNDAWERMKDDDCWVLEFEKCEE